MTTPPAMLRAHKLFWDLLILHLGLWSTLGEASCLGQLYVRRNVKHSVSAGTFFTLECPVNNCVHRPNVTWCKFNGTNCLHLGDRRHLHTSWEERQNAPVFILHFEPISPSDNGTYSCSANLDSRVVISHSIDVYVTEQTQNNSEYPLTNGTSDSGPPSVEERADRAWLFYSLLPVGALLPLCMACFCLLFFLKRHQGRKQPSDIVRREINMDDIPVSPAQNSHTPPSEAEIYDNDPWFGTQSGSEVSASPHQEGSRQGVIYASLNRSVIRKHPRQPRTVQEAPTEYASICVRS